MGLADALGALEAARRGRGAVVGTLAVAVSLSLVIGQRYMSRDLQSCGACGVGTNWLAGAFLAGLALYLVRWPPVRPLLMVALAAMMGLASVHAVASRRVEVTMMAEMRACPTKRVTEFYMEPPAPGRLRGAMMWDCHPRLWTAGGLTFSQWSGYLSAFVAALALAVAIGDVLLAVARRFAPTDRIGPAGRVPAEGREGGVA